MSANSGLSDSSVVVRSSDVVEAEVDGEIVALNIERGTCYGLNKVGSRIWQIVSQPSRVTDIGARLIAEYEVDEETCRQQVLELLEDLRNEGLIRIVEAPTAP